MCQVATSAYNYEATLVPRSKSESTAGSWIRKKVGVRILYWRSGLSMRMAFPGSHERVVYLTSGTILHSALSPRRRTLLFTGRPGRLDIYNLRYHHGALPFLCDWTG